VESDDASHIPVLTDVVMEFLAPEPGDVVVDVTVGSGGHARLFADRIGPAGVLIGMDVDASALERAEKALAGSACSVCLRRANFREVGRVLSDCSAGGADVLFADLGLSSPQLGDEGRGFSFRTDGPLDMRMDDRLTTTAADLVNRLKEEELSDLIFHYSQERFSRRIAKRICRDRRERRITTTSALVSSVCGALSVNPDSRKSRIHPATRVFQALRIAVNDELGALEALLEGAAGCLKPGGRFGVISFHSLEDGRVKRDFRRRKQAGMYEILTKRPIIAAGPERERNPRSRSAKFRVARKG